MQASAGFVLWLTGLPASGKSTLAHALQQACLERGISTQVLDSDDLRQVLTPEPRYTAEERDWFYSVLIYIAVLLADNGVPVIIAATASRRAYRQKARARLDSFAEIYVACPPEICRQRDPKGLWQKAAAGEITNLPGMNAPYEEPLAPDVCVDSEHLSPQQAAQKILQELHALIEAA